MNGQPRNPVLDPRTPWNSALAFIEIKHLANGQHALHYHAGQFFCWTGTHYRHTDNDTIRAEIYSFLDSANSPTRAGGQLPFQATSRRVTDIVDALRAAANLLNGMEPPFWLREVGGLPANEFVACENGLLHIPTRKLYAHTPDFFTHFALPFSYDTNAQEPKGWILFLHSLWGEDAEAIGTFQEICGYLLAGDTSQQKIFLIVGPTRSGKGTIARILTKLFGPANVVAPPLASLQTNFGLAPLINKSVAIIADARLSGRVDQSLIVERLLSISGEDSLTADRKYLPVWTGRLKSRFLLLTNELPRLTDSSVALANRFITLVLTRSFLGKEDLGLETRLATELPGILNWALEGWDRLRRRGYFVQPTSSKEVSQELQDLSSPISAFVRECCDLGEGKSVQVDVLYNKWVSWCISCGRDRFGTKQSFGRDLRTFVPWLTVYQPREGKDRNRVYQGLGLKPDASS